MNKLLKKALLMAVILCLVISAAIFTSSAAPATYSQESNSGTRDEICTTLNGTSAASYYTGQYSYDNLSTLSESQLLSTLRKLMTDTHDNISSYDDCKKLSPITDCEKGGDGSSFLTIYSSYEAEYNDFKSGQGWNREHVWPQSLGGFGTSGGGADLHHIRPSESKINSTRGNHKYGENNGSEVTGNLSGESGGTYANSVFEPLDNVKGDVARICLYVYVRWGGTSGYTCNNLEIVFTDIETLLSWCELDPVDTWEMGRNEVVYGIQGNRNVFIDYPELAWIMLGEDVPDDMITPSGEASDGNNNSGSSSCSHTSTSIVDKKDATCEVAGYTGDVKCNNCKVIVTKGTVITAKGHAYGDPVITKEPTATEPGTATKTCGKCSTVITIVISATGENLPIEIVSNNVFYKDTLNLMYAVRADEGYNVVVKIYDGDNNLIETITSYNIEDVNGEILKTFTSNYGVPAQNIDKEFFAVAELLDGDRVVATTNKERYSVLEYLYERLTVSENVTDSQRTMYKRLIAYANSVDVLLNNDTESSIANYSYVIVEGGTVDGLYSTAILKAGSKLSSLTAAAFGEGNGILAWNIKAYDFENAPTSVTYKDEELKAGSFTLKAGMGYVLSLVAAEDEKEEKTYSYTFTGKQFSANGTQKLGGVDWTLSGNGGFWGNDNSKGHQFGSGNNPYKSMALVSDSFTNVSKIIINTSGASSINATLNVYVGDTLVGTVSLTTTPTEYMFDVSDLSGEIRFEYTQTSSKALYIKSIKVEYAE